MKILLVRLRLIGDVVFTTPVVRAVRRAYPDAEITYLVEPAAAPVVASNPHLSHVRIVPHARGWARVREDWRLGRELRAAQFDVAVDLHGGPRSALLTWLSRAPLRLGYDVAGRTWMYTRVVARSKTFRPRHAVENQWDVFSALMDPAVSAPPEPDGDRVEMAVDAGSRANAAARVRAMGVPDEGRVVVMHVSAGNPFRRWPESSFAAVAARLASADPRRWVIVSAGPSDQPAASRVIAEARRLAGPAGDRIQDGEGLSLVDLRATLDRAALYIGGDSGPLHIAATTAVPIVGLYGPTTPARSAPWRPSRFPAAAVEAPDLACRPCDQRVCVTQDFRCLTSISVDQVLDAAEALLARTA